MSEPLVLIFPNFGLKAEWVMAFSKSVSEAKEADESSTKNTMDDSSTKNTNGDSSSTKNSTVETPTKNTVDKTPSSESPTPDSSSSTGTSTAESSPSAESPSPSSSKLSRSQAKEIPHPTSSETSYFNVAKGVSAKKKNYPSSTFHSPSSTSHPFPPPPKFVPRRTSLPTPSSSKPSKLNTRRGSVPEVPNKRGVVTPTNVSPVSTASNSSTTSPSDIPEIPSNDQGSGDLISPTAGNLGEDVSFSQPEDGFGSSKSLAYSTKIYTGLKVEDKTPIEILRSLRTCPKCGCAGVMNFCTNCGGRLGRLTGGRRV